MENSGYAVKSLESLVQIGYVLSFLMLLGRSDEILHLIM